MLWKCVLKVMILFELCSGSSRAFRASSALIVHSDAAFGRIPIQRANCSRVISCSPSRSSCSKYVWERNKMFWDSSTWSIGISHSEASEREALYKAESRWAIRIHSKSNRVELNCCSDSDWMWWTGGQEGSLELDWEAHAGELGAEAASEERLFELGPGERSWAIRVGLVEELHDGLVGQHVVASAHANTLHLSHTDTHRDTQEIITWNFFGGTYMKICFGMNLSAS